MSARDTVSTYLVRGDDASLVAQEVRSLIAEIVGNRDHGLVVEEIGGGPGDELNVGAVVDACLTPPFLIDRRVVVVRDVGRLSTGDAPRLVEVVDSPLPTTVLVLVGGGGTVPAPLVKAIKAHGRIVEVTTTKAGERKAWLHDHLRGAPVKLEPAAENLLVRHVGEDLGRVEGLLGALGAAYGEGARISVDDLTPYLGEAGNVPRYELTDAIDRGEPGLALVVLHRMLEAGGLAPIQIVATLHGHFANMLALDGDDITGEGDAAAALGVAPFVAKKALEQSRRLGSSKIADAINLIARADLAVRGESGLSDELVVEVLVARLARLTRPTRSARPSRSGGAAGAARSRVGGRR
jgi:DNA polymerase-3 subunit delta